VVRGGSFNNNANNVRCAVRNNNNPDNRNDNNGFRVVVSHGFLRTPLRKEGYAHQQPVAVTASTARFESRRSRLPVSTQQPRLEAVEAYTKGGCALPGFGLRPGWRSRSPFLASANVIQRPPDRERIGLPAKLRFANARPAGPGGWKLEVGSPAAPAGACMW